MKTPISPLRLDHQIFLTDGGLETDLIFNEGIELVDRETENGPVYYMINCAHPEHFDHALARGEDWTRRIKGIRANASRMSHAELDEADALDEGDPREFGRSRPSAIAFVSAGVHAKNRLTG